MLRLVLLTSAILTATAAPGPGEWNVGPDRASACSAKIQRLHVDELPEEQVFSGLDTATVVTGATELLMKDDKHWSREEFVKRFGNYQIEPGTPAMIANYGPGYRTIERSQMSLRGYLDQMRTTAGTPGELFVSAPVNPPLLGAVKALMQQPGPEDWFYADGNTHEVLLSVGGAKRGLPMHGKHLFGCG